MTWAASFDDGRPGFRIAVVAVVVLLHLLFYLALGRVQGGSTVAAVPSGAMRVEFISRRPAPAPAPPPAATEPRRREAPKAGPPVRRSQQRPPLRPARSAPAQASEPGPSRPLVLDWRTAGGDSEFPTEPGRPQAPGAMSAGGPDRIRMRRQASGQAVVEGAARALGFWPEGYESDPCPRTRRNIGNLMTDARPSGRRALEEELRRRQVACRQ